MTQWGSFLPAVADEELIPNPWPQPRGGWLSVGVRYLVHSRRWNCQMPNVSGHMVVALGFRGLGSGAQGLGAGSRNQVKVGGLP